MSKILFIIRATLPKKFTRKQFCTLFYPPHKQGEREGLCTSHPSHCLQRLVEQGKLKHLGEGKYQLV